MQFDWEQEKPAVELVDGQKALVREIGEKFLNTGAGLAGHPKRVQLGKDRNWLNRFVELGLSRNNGDIYYPTFASLYFLDPNLRDPYASLVDCILSAIKSLYQTSNYPRTFPAQEVEEKFRSHLSQKAFASYKAFVERGILHFQRAAFLLQDFTIFVSPSLTGTDPRLGSVNATENILDYDNLQDAWKRQSEGHPRPQQKPTGVRPSPETIEETAANRPSTPRTRELSERATKASESNNSPESVSAENAAPQATQPTEEQQTSASESTLGPSKLPDMWMLSDRPIEERFAEQDHFQFIDYANALASLLNHKKTETPFTMAINAPWGAGKTTLANMIEAQLNLLSKDSGQVPHIICRFNAWMHDDAPNLATAFVSEVGRTANKNRNWLMRLWNPFPSALRDPGEQKRLLFVFGAFVLALTLALSWWTGEHFEHIERHKKYEASKIELYQTTKTVNTDSTGKDTSTGLSESRTMARPVSPMPQEAAAPDRADFYLDKFQSRLVVLVTFFTTLAGVAGILAKILSSTALGIFVKSPEKAAESGAIQEAEKQLKRLISQATWRGNRFIVFVDDIERCRPPRSIDVMDAVNQLMDHKNVIVVFLGDMSAVAAAAQLKYKDLAELYVPNSGIALTGPERGKEAFGRLYLQKIIQYQFDLPIPPTGEIQTYMMKLAIASQGKGNESG